MEKRNIQSVERALSILEFCAKEGGAGVTEIAKGLSLNKSTAYGLIRTLENLNYLVKKQETDDYHLSLKILELCSCLHQTLPIIDVAKPYLLDLVEMYGETVHLVAAGDMDVAYIDKVASPKSIRVETNVGEYRGLYCTGVGKAILANRTDHEIGAYLDRVELVPYTSKTLINKRDLLNEIDKTRHRGYAIDNEETFYELFCIAVALCDGAGVPQYAISISMPKYRLTPDLEVDMARTLRRIKSEIENHF